MTDKVQKIRAFLVGIADADGVSTILAKAIEKKILPYIDSLQEEPVSEDLGEYINELSKQFPEVSFAKLSRVAVRVAKWQKEKDQSTIELAEDHAMLAGMEKMKEQMMKDAVDTELDDVSGVLVVPVPYHNGVAGEKCKVLVIKED